MKLPRFSIHNAILLILISGFAIRSQTPPPPPPPVDDGEVIKVESRLVIIPVSVTDSAGLPVLGLKGESFKVWEEGKPQTIENVSDAASVPLEIVLLFDISASTDPMFKFEQQTAAKFLQEVMRRDDRATIFGIGQTPLLIQPRDTAEKSAASITAISTQKGATAFFDSVTAATTYLRTKSPEGRRKVIVVISDGEDNFSAGVQKAQRIAERKIVDNSPDPELKKLGKLVYYAQQSAKTSERMKVLRSLQDADTVFYSINPAGSSYLLNQISKFGQENMEKFALETGGTAFVPKFLPVDTKDALQNAGNSKKNNAALETIFRQLANELRAQYLVQYYSDSEFPVNKYVKLKVNLNQPGNLRLRAREGYYVK